VKRYCLRFVNILILFLKEEELPDQWKESIIVPVHKKDDKTNFIEYPLRVKSVHR
jgi:hypothetical protein